mmetsp:Transcript_61276/g.154668  ORF Transcript_61276/g.154668 Transcript_61276/m.154668 type:complete len:232 (+) Transcript_61276:667-1362(+)
MRVEGRTHLAFVCPAQSESTLPMTAKIKPFRWCTLRHISGTTREGLRSSSGCNEPLGPPSSRRKRSVQSSLWSPVSPSFSEPRFRRGFFTGAWLEVRRSQSTDCEACFGCGADWRRREIELRASETSSLSCRSSGASNSRAAAFRLTASTQSSRSSRSSGVAKAIALQPMTEPFTVAKRSSRSALRSAVTPLMSLQPSRCSLTTLSSNSLSVRSDSAVYLGAFAKVRTISR